MSDTDPTAKMPTEELKSSSTNKEEFPYDQFPWKLTYKDGKETRKCFFECEEHLKKHIQRCKLKKNQFKVECKPCI